MQLNKEMSLLHADKQGSAICGVQLDQENSFSFSPWGSNFRAMNSWGATMVEIFCTHYQN